jgi:hypothetical protein
VSSVQRGEALIAQRVDRVVMPIYDRFQKEVVSQNAKIDTRKNYRRLQAHCKNWQYEYGN